MEKILWIITAATVIIFVGSSLIFMTTSSIGSISGFMDNTETAGCQTQADLWETGDSIDKECIGYLEDENQEEALSSAIEPEIT